MMYRSIKNGLSVLLLHKQGFVPSHQASKPPLLAVERLVLSYHLGGGGVRSSAATAMGSRRFFHAGGGASRDMFPAGGKLYSEPRPPDMFWAGGACWIMIFPLSPFQVNVNALEAHKNELLEALVKISICKEHESRNRRLSFCMVCKNLLCGVCLGQDFYGEHDATHETFKVYINQSYPCVLPEDIARLFLHSCDSIQTYSCRTGNLVYILPRPGYGRGNPSTSAGGVLNASGSWFLRISFTVRLLARFQQKHQQQKHQQQKKQTKQQQLQRLQRLKQQQLQLQRLKQQQLQLQRLKQLKLQVLMLRN